MHQSPHAKHVLIPADGGGRNESRVWTGELQQSVDETGLCIHICHGPPGTSTRNHDGASVCVRRTRQNEWATPLVRAAVILTVIAAPTAEAGLHCALSL